MELSSTGVQESHWVGHFSASGKRSEISLTQGDFRLAAMPIRRGEFLQSQRGDAAEKHTLSVRGYCAFIAEAECAAGEQVEDLDHSAEAVKAGAGIRRRVTWVD